VTTHVALLEALLFASGKPATVERLEKRDVRRHR
jgi:chromosome segregation and condensation protein ScpB